MSRPDKFPDCMALSSKREACLGYRETFTKLDLEEKENERLRAALKPFSDLAHVALAEAPADAGYVSLFVDSAGRSHRITLDQLRAAADHQQSAAEPMFVPKCEHCRDTGWRSFGPGAMDKEPCGCEADLGAR